MDVPMLISVFAKPDDSINKIIVKINIYFIDTPAFDYF
jgi:hypothetical protein